MKENINSPEYWEEQFDKEKNREFDRWCFERFEYVSVYTDIEGNFLDVGCGLGNLCRYVKGRYPFIDVHGAEFSKSVIEDAKKLSDPRIKFHYWDGKRLPFKDGTFQTVAATEVIEHIDEDKVVAFVDELARVTKEEGRIILTTPYRGILDESPGKENAVMSVEHIKEYTPNELYDLLKGRFKGQMRMSVPPLKIDFHNGNQVRSHYFVVMFHPHKDMPLIARKMYYA